MLHKLYFFNVDQDAIFGVLDGVLRLREEGSPGLKRVNDIIQVMDSTLLDRIAVFREELSRGTRYMANFVLVTDAEIDLLGSAVAIFDWGLAKTANSDRYIDTVRRIIVDHTGKKNI